MDENGSKPNKRQPVDVDLLVSRRLLLARQMRGFTQQHVAERAGITFQQLQKYERGLNRVSAGRLCHFAAIFDLPATWFFLPLEDSEIVHASEREFIARMAALPEPVAECISNLMKAVRR